MCGQVWWPILRICALYLTHPSAHTYSREHTHHEHTPGEVGSQCCSARGAVGVRCLAQEHLSHGIEGGERALVIHSPTYNPSWTWDLNPWPLDFESDSLNIRPRLPISNCWIKSLFLFFAHKKCSHSFGKLLIMTDVIGLFYQCPY